MSSLIETSVLARLKDTASPDHLFASEVIVLLSRQQEKLYITAQNLVEFRSVATRPINVNGLGMTAEEAEADTEDFEQRFELLPENDAIYPAWKAIVKAGGVIG